MFLLNHYEKTKFQAHANNLDDAELSQEGHPHKSVEVRWVRVERKPNDLKHARISLNRSTNSAQQAS